MRTLHINGMTPAALAIAIALKEKGLDFSIVDIDWRQTPAALASLAPGLELTNTLEGEFPILVDEGQAVSDSYFVLEYLDDKYADPPLRPGDAHGQWQLQAMARFLGERVAPSVATLGVAQIFAPSTSAEEVTAAFGGAGNLTCERRDAWLATPAQAGDQGAIAESNRKLALFVERIERCLTTGERWLLGARYTLSDVAAYTLLDPFLSGTLDAGSVTIPAAVREWHRRVDSRPAVAAAKALRPPAFLPGPEHARWG